MVNRATIHEYISRGPNTAGSMWRVAASQPNWVTKWALLTFFIVIGIPIFLLIMFAIIAAVLVFGALAGAHWLRVKARSLFAGRDTQRKNVRIIHRERL